MHTPGKFTENDRLNLELEMDHARLASLTDEQLLGTTRSVPGIKHPVTVLSATLSRVSAKIRASSGAFLPHATFAEDTH
ncbi:hypothetical protein TSA6c_16865 [Azospirillum sp. TSA6c]|uniref:hypothetical protein n=1 Tax=Azospirillum sp. TSA6c TaxID=709813 RepID=UPI000D61854C|nr:hypothetical protein [Azospirillum sp. TSA6c]PWC48110.1 hypothetical protein TSA6c_16865 [Azospirillum sp. TSA6c]